MTPIAWNTPSLIRSMSFPSLPFISSGTVKPCVITVRTMMSIDMSAKVDAFASFAISRYQLNG